MTNLDDRIMEFDGPLLLTSDEPVAAGVDSQNPHRPAGVGNADSIFFPLDPSHALVMMHQHLRTNHAGRSSITRNRTRSVILRYQLNPAGSIRAPRRWIARSPNARVGVEASENQPRTAGPRGCGHRIGWTDHPSKATFGEQ